MIAERVRLTARTPGRLRDTLEQAAELQGATLNQFVVRSAGGFGLFVDAQDVAARDWYERFGFVPLPDHPLQLFLPLATIEEALRGA